MIAYRIEPRAVEPAETVVSLRSSRTRMLIVDAGGRILAADLGAMRLLESIERPGSDRLPAAIHAVVREWLARGCGSEFVATPYPWIVVRALQLEGELAVIGLLIEPVATREDLAAGSRRFGLSRRELDVLRLLLAGDSACEIAARLSIAEYTVGDYIKRIFVKTQARNRSEMIAKVLGWRHERAAVPFEVESRS